MKISKIAAICKKQKRIVHMCGDDLKGAQYLGTGQALYRIDDMPELSQESILALFDAPEDKRADWMYHPSAMGVDLRDYFPEEGSVDPVGFPIRYHGAELQMYCADEEE